MGQQTASQAAQSAVARLSYLEGSSQVASSGSNIDAVEAALNMPLWPGQTIQVGQHGAAEIEFADGSLLRVTENSSATLVRLQTEAQIGLADGLYYFELRATDNPQFSVFAGDLSITPTQNASFRVRLASGQVEVAVLSGSVNITRTNAYTVDLQSGESLRSDTRNNRRYLLAEGVSQESWDNWNERRAQAVLDDSASQTIARDDYAADQGYGWSDLDASGTWYAMPGEGLVWQPYGISASFDPYGYGSWVYSPSGYTWASGYSWGWVPYRCGEWRYLAGPGWFWIPSGGCRSYGGGWHGAGWQRGGAGHGPHGWHPPHPPPPPTSVAGSGGIHIEPPTIPVRPIDGSPILGVASTGGGSRRRQAIQIGEVSLQPLAPIRQPRVSQGESAVGSAFQRDFPIQGGTHQPIIGQQGTGLVALPGRADWHRVPHPTSASGAAGGETAPRHRTAGIPVIIGPAGVAAWGRPNGNGDHASPVTTPTSDVPLNATGAAPFGANGPAPTGANGPVPTGADGPSPVRATGNPPIRVPRDPGGTPSVRTFGGAGATPYSGQPLRPGMRPPEAPAPTRPTPVAPIAPAPGPAPRLAPVAPAPTPRTVAPVPSPAPQLRTAPTSAPTIPSRGSAR